ncbi:Receptor-like serine/threonine-protein kinase ALE2 [Acorus calamus]|uniref:Receptor-like serine/threonine-protein kinase ALE2 n=1 Tax=Acorus calamus TaxID=4465 RepID=A0AAV9CZC1_ACOCL|nr:Receptor-like serine/threonine-protein kinase ALE2 [Acorus calamus]
MKIDVFYDDGWPMWATNLMRKLKDKLHKIRTSSVTSLIRSPAKWITKAFSLARPILRDKDRLEELLDRRLEGKYPKDDFVRVCTIAAACVAPEAAQRPTMGEVVQSLKMVQRVT